ncbi:MAG: hypothetical protein E7070_11875 [Bacteroidales bacterium]|nr:hypothetical protein [Bacteroidales bacterium]
MFVTYKKVFFRKLVDSLKRKEVDTFHQRIVDLDLLEFEEIFRKNGISSVEVLISLTETNLKEIGIEKVGDRRKIMCAINYLLMKYSPKTDSQPTIVVKSGNGCIVNLLIIILVIIVICML